MNDHAHDLDAWIGRSETAEDLVAPGLVAGMAATLDLEEKWPRDGDPVPPLWHWMFFPSRARQSELGGDGHPALGGFMPAIGPARRMFAGSSIRFIAPLRVGDHVRRDSRIVAIERKEGRSGPLVFVRIEHALSTDVREVIVETQTIVYRQSETGTAASPPRAQIDNRPWRRSITPDPVLLFRYSALTFNGHRIHYDRPYATGVEGYPGLVVHGPLIATLLADLARRETGGREISAFSFRAASPLYATAPFLLAGEPSEDGSGAQLLAASDSGDLAMEAHIKFGD